MTQMYFKQVVDILHRTHVHAAAQTARSMAAAVGLGEEECEEIALVVTELATNLLTHASGGSLTLTSLEANDCPPGIQLETRDAGPGIIDVNQAMTDGFSTAGGLGYGLGTINRIMDEFDLKSPCNAARGTYICTRKWLKSKRLKTTPCPLVFGTATRPHPRMRENGDAFVIKQDNEHTLLGVIDGLGHGPEAFQAAQAARNCVEAHWDQPLVDLFRSVGHACSATRGVVMGLARIDWTCQQLSFAGIGDVEARLCNPFKSIGIISRRGIVGHNAPKPLIIQHPWERDNILVLHSDGLSSTWQWKDFAHLATQPPQKLAQHLLLALGKDTDDASIAVGKMAES